MSEREKQVALLTHVCGLQKRGTDEPAYKEGLETQAQRAGLWTRDGERGERLASTSRAPVGHWEL